MFPCEYRKLETPNIVPVPEDGAVCVDVCVCGHARVCVQSRVAGSVALHGHTCQIVSTKFISKSIRNLLYSKSNFIFSVNHI